MDYHHDVMSKIILTAIITILAVSLIFLLYYYPYRRLMTLFNLSSNKPLAYILFLLALSFPLAMLLSRVFDGPVLNLFYTLSAVCLGFAFFGLGVFGIIHFIELATDLLRSPTPRPLWGWLSIGLTLTGGLYGLINASIVRTSWLTIKLEGLVHPVRIVHLSDIHLGAVYGKGFISRLVDGTNDLKPDLVAITGDLLDGSGKLDYEKVRPLERLTAPAFFVTGNHENYEGADQCCRLIARSGVCVLRNQVADCSGLQIIGMDAPQSGGGSGEINHSRQLSGIPLVDPSRPAVLLYHIPLGLKQAARRGVDLVLSGHTHNGQMFPFSLFLPLAYRHYAGHRRIDEMDVVIYQGVGTWGPPMRIGSRSEIVVIDLIPH